MMRFTALAMLGAAAILGVWTVMPTDHSRLKNVRLLPAVFPSGVTWSANGSKVAAISHLGANVTVWKSNGTRLADMVRLGTYVDNSIAFLSDDTMLTAVSDTAQMAAGLAFTLWDARTGSVRRTIEGPNRASSPQSIMSSTSRSHRMEGSLPLWG